MHRSLSFYLANRLLRPLRRRWLFLDTSPRAICKRLGRPFTVSMRNSNPTSRGNKRFPGCDRSFSFLRACFFLIVACLFNAEFSWAYVFVSPPSLSFIERNQNTSHRSHHVFVLFSSLNLSLSLSFGATRAFRYALLQPSSRRHRPSINSLPSLERYRMRTHLTLARTTMIPIGQTSISRSKVHRLNTSSPIESFQSIER